jgi:hypothetical protein
LGGARADARTRQTGEDHFYVNDVVYMSETNTANRRSMSWFSDACALEVEDPYIVNRNWGT